MHPSNCPPFQPKTKTTALNCELGTPTPTGECLCRTNAVLATIGGRCSGRCSDERLGMDGLHICTARSLMPNMTTDK